MGPGLRLSQYGDFVLQGDVSLSVGLPSLSPADRPDADVTGEVWVGLAPDALHCQPCRLVSRNPDGFWQRPADFREHDVPEFRVEMVGALLLRRLLRQADSFGLALDGASFGSAQCRENWLLRDGAGGDYRELLSLNLRGRLGAEGLALSITGRLGPGPKPDRVLAEDRWLDARFYQLRLWLPWNVLILRDILHGDRRATFGLTPQAPPA